MSSARISIASGWSPSSGSSMMMNFGGLGCKRSVERAMNLSVPSERAERGKS